MNTQTIERIRKFTADRDWDQFHSPANLAKSISIEANELLECFQWSDTDYDLQHVKEELADVLVYCRDLLDKLDLDEDEIVNMKMDQNEAKYPVEKAKGTSNKYDELQVLIQNISYNSFPYWIQYAESIRGSLQYSPYPDDQQFQSIPLIFHLGTYFRHTV